MKIITHDGRFHADEVLAIAIMSIVEPAVKKDTLFYVVRTRDQKIINDTRAAAKASSDCCLLIDIGLEYNPSALQFDHHQAGCKEVFNERSNTQLSSAGMIYKEYGRQAIAQIAKEISSVISDATLAEIYEAIYFQFVHEFDAHDNGVFNTGALQQGIDMGLGDLVMCGSHVPVYTSLPLIVTKFNRVDLDCVGSEQFEAFEQALGFVRSAFYAVSTSAIRRSALKDYVLANLAKEFHIQENDDIVCIRTAKTLGVIRDVFRALSKKPTALVVSRNGTEFEVRRLDANVGKPLPQPLADLSAACVFFHKSGFLVKFSSFSALTSYLDQALGKPLEKPEEFFSASLLKYFEDKGFRYTASV